MNNIDILEEKEKRLRAYLAVLNEENILYKKEDAIEGIIKLFETLIAENKELKEMLKHSIEYTNKLEKDLFENASNYVIPKSKIKAKIEEVKDGTFDAKIVLQSLLGRSRNGN